MDYKFQKFTPDQSMNLGIYEEAIDYAFSQDDIRNIAISGAYGAGKSSVIETYEKKHLDKKFVHISLAHFENGSAVQKTDMLTDDEPCDKSEKEQKNVDPEVRLEGKILNQLIHQIDPERIPLTDFKIKREVDPERLWGYTWWCAGFCLLLFFIIFNKQWCKLIPGMNVGKAAATFLASREAVVIAGVCLIAIAIKGFYALLKLQNEKKFLKKISIKGNDIEILEDCEDSYFDRYLNEVLYLFDHVDADAIVFEDIDRFGTNIIFEKLREINTLVGKRRAPLRFIYLLRDDIFSSNDRTKFFDFIVPVVPVIDGSNAYDKFIEYFKSAGIFQLFSEEFLQGLSLFVDDMRVLKNIQNEFLIYKGKFDEKPIELNWDMLLAILTYKNLFPKDFGELQLKRGYVYTLFESKERFCEEEREKLQTEIDELQIKLQDSEREVCKNIDELNAIFFSVKETLKVGNQEEKAFANRAEFVAAIMKNPKQVYRSSYSGWYTFDVQPVIDKFQKNEEYKKRKKSIELQDRDARIRMKAKISRLENRNHKLENSFLKDFITRENADQIFGVSYVNPLGEENHFEEIKRSPYFPLIKYLIQDGYIDETYTDYMTYFYENSITANDKNFLRAVIGKKGKPYSYSLNNPQRVIGRLKKAYFEEEETLNFDLLDGLFEDTVQHGEKLKTLLKQIEDTEPIKFVAEYLEYSLQIECSKDAQELMKYHHRREFVRKLNEEWTNTAVWILTEKEFEKVRAAYVAVTFCVSSDDIIEELNQDDMLKQYIEGHGDIFTIDDRDVESFMHGMQLLNVKVKKLDFESVNKELFMQIYRSNTYELNPAMVNLMLEKVYRIEPYDIDWETNLTHIFWREEEPLSEYVEANIADYIKVVLAETKQIWDEEQIVLHVLNHEKIASDDKKEYIEKLETVIKSLSSIKDMMLWKSLMEQELVLENIANMCDYYFKSGNGLDSCLISYINKSRNNLSLELMDFEIRYGKDSKLKMFNSIVCCDKLQNDKYEKLLNSFHRYYDAFSHKGVSEEKIRILIRNNIVGMTEENLLFFRQEYMTCLEEFISHNPKAYLDIIEDKNYFEETELSYILKMYPLKSYPLKASEMNKTEDKLKDKVEDDVETWVANRKIQKLATEHLSYLLSEEVFMPISLLNVLLADNGIDIDDKKELLALHLNKMDEAMALESLKIMRLTKYLSLWEGKRPSFDITEANKKLLTALVEKGWISSFSEDKQNSDQYKAYGKKRKEVSFKKRM